MIINIIDEHVEKIAPIAGSDTFVRLLTLGGLLSEQVKRWIPYVSLHWTLNINKMWTS